jgi:hypothetical protein
MNVRVSTDRSSPRQFVSAPGGMRWPMPAAIIAPLRIWSLRSRCAWGVRRATDADRPGHAGPAGHDCARERRRSAPVRGATGLVVELQPDSTNSRAVIPPRMGRPRSTDSASIFPKVVTTVSEVRPDPADLGVNQGGGLTSSSVLSGRPATGHLDFDTPPNDTKLRNGHRNQVPTVRSRHTRNPCGNKTYSSGLESDTLKFEGCLT